MYMYEEEEDILDLLSLNVFARASLHYILIFSVRAIAFRNESVVALRLSYF